MSKVKFVLLNTKLKNNLNNEGLVNELTTAKEEALSMGALITSFRGALIGGLINHI